AGGAGRGVAPGVGRREPPPPGRRARVALARGLRAVGAPRARPTGSRDGAPMSREGGIPTREDDGDTQVRSLLTPLWDPYARGRRADRRGDRARRFVGSLRARTTVPVPCPTPL